jgi:hypothetical protein
MDHKDVVPDIPYGYLVVADGVGPVGGTGCKHTVHGPLWIALGVAGEHATVTLIQPGQNNNLLPDFQAVQGRHVFFGYFNTRGRVAACGLFGALPAACKGGADLSDGYELHGRRHG